MQPVDGRVVGGRHTYDVTIFRSRDLSRVWDDGDEFGFIGESSLVSGVHWWLGDVDILFFQLITRFDCGFPRLKKSTCTYTILNNLRSDFRTGDPWEL